MHRELVPSTATDLYQNGRVAREQGVNNGIGWEFFVGESPTLSYWGADAVRRLAVW